ncbi:enoyl-CoA hydratase-related protein [Sporichthya sp.]|uniref:enoyl-CoA hydratase/isomerase family protein n=1 Tax=Sporichthya sp. TaxID=65475 RepID=UPI0017AF7E21|nr:enoyl-CoA hydratase-related protein [Sporichthya sp.]MBA3743575.1 enoyl-CoA hydratase/isomerase family protein [Sporichthya sp.]
MTSYQRLEYTVAAAVATITLTRVEARNSMDMVLKGELAEVIERAATDQAVRAVVVTGSGNAFCAGGDVSEMDLNTDPVTSRARLRTLLQTVYLPLAEMEKPTIAAVNGHCYGSGLSLMMACDLVVAADDALFSCAFVKVGLLPDCGAMYFLPRRLPMNVAKELIFTGRRFDAAEGKELGLVNRVVPAADLAKHVGELAAELAAGPTVALGMAKTLLERSLLLGPRDFAELEALAMGTIFSTEDHLAARKAFASKSTPEFKGR